ncbi:MAG: NUDIX domain-containing protein [Candidatus Kerfeldbacteria bacterium]|nr:NUDIX domain-containing protein [Candidatus Kerfeldbacteria bacterium]
MGSRKTQSAGGVVLNAKGEVLIVSQHGTTWSLPKGHLEPGEDELTAARREVTEESGVNNLQLIRKLGRYSRHAITNDGTENKSVIKTITMFLFRTDQTMLQPVDPENPEARWVAWNNVASLLTHQKDKEFFQSVVR